MHSQKKIKYNFNDSLGFIVVKTGRLIENRLRYNFEEKNISITPQQWAVLTYLWNEDGISQQKIANVFSKDKTSITRLLNNMEKNGFIIRKQGVKDRRNKNIFLTNSSKELKEKSIQVAQETLSEIIDGIDSSNLKMSKQILKEICSNINRL
ncbi:MAG: MarR family transcriptional regulator [Melioribacteraceae bacterium]